MASLDLDRYVPFLFNIAMALYFVYAFLFPESTDFWLVKDGIAILILEFLAVFVILITATALGKDSGWTYEGPALNTHSFWLLLAAILSMALMFSVVLGVWVLFVYFVLSLGVKALQMRGQPDAKAEGLRAAYATLFLLLGAFGAVFVSPLLAGFFPDSVASLSEALPTNGFDADGEAVNPAFIALWGAFYFVGIALITSRLLPMRTATPEDIEKWNARFRIK